MNSFGSNRFETLEPRRLLSSIIRVDVNSPAASPDGASWGTAYPDLQSALVIAQSGDQIWVADGTYKPTSGTDRSSSFQLPDGVSLFGGYSGASAENPDQRDPAIFTTVLSGDIGVVGDHTDNSYHVVTDLNTTVRSTFDGFTVTGGWANDDASGALNGDSGGGLLLNSGDISINDCTFQANGAITYGGGVALISTAGSSISHCTFLANSDYNVQMYFDKGGALCLLGPADVESCSFIGNSVFANGGAIAVLSTDVIRNCTFQRNTAGGGGAIYVYTGSATVDECKFFGNSAPSSGGAIDAFGPATVDNSIFVGNSAVRFGGAAHNNVTIVNSVLVNNSAGTRGGAIDGNSNAKVVNSVAWNDTAPISSEFSFGTASKSDVQGGFPGTGNINADPQFVRNPSPGADATWGTADDDYGDLREQITSPTIDAGDNNSVPAGVTTDLAGGPRFYDFPGVNDPGAIVDMGAFELTNHLPLLHVAASQTLALPAGGYHFIVDQLQLDSNSTLDLQDDDLILPNATLSAIQSLINSARHGGLWNGAGITSSAAKNNPQHNTTLGAMTGSDYKSISPANPTFDGEAIDNSSVLIKYTYYGDANFDGHVDGGDYSRIDSTFNKEHTAGNIGGWLNGDFNGDGVVDGADYSLIDGAFNSQNTARRFPVGRPIGSLPTLTGIRG